MAITTTPANSPNVEATRRFVLACRVHSQHLKAAAPAPMPMPMTAARAVDVQEVPSCGSPAEKLTILYGGAVVVFDHRTSAKVGDLIRHAGEAAALMDVPIARQASLKRFLSNRNDRSAAAEVPTAAATTAKKKKKKSKVEATSSWLTLTLGSSPDMHAE